MQDDDIDALENEDGTSQAGDGKWRPNALIMAILYKVSGRK